MGLGIIKITKPALLDALRLPADTVIVGIDDREFFQSDEIAIKINHPGCPTFIEGGAIPRVVPKHIRHLAVPETIEFVGWQ